MFIECSDLVRKSLQCGNKMNYTNLLLTGYECKPVIKIMEYARKIIFVKLKNLENYFFGLGAFEVLSIRSNRD